MIIYFSGTGNTRRCALRLGRLLGDKDVREFSADDLCNPSSASLDIRESDKRIVWAFPTYSWGIPPVVADYMAKAAFSERVRAARHYMLTTCGDDMAYADRQWRHILNRRGIEGVGAFAVVMPNTYTLMKGFNVDSPELAAAKLSASTAAVDKVAEAIRRHGASSLVRGSFPWIKSSVIYPWFKRFAMSPKPFHANAGCISCGLCERSCPMQNITMEKGTPVWGDKCALCLRCYHICPRHAVAYGTATDGKGQYMCPDK